MPPVENPVENTVPVSPVDSAPVAAPVATPVAAKSNNTIKIIAIIVIVGLLLICCASAIVGYIIYSTNQKIISTVETIPTVTTDADGTDAVSPTSSNSDLLFADGPELSPSSNAFTASIIGKTRLLGPSDKFASLVIGLGNPSYSVSFLYRSDWTTSTREINSIILHNPDDESFEYGALLFPKSDALYGKTCKEIVTELFNDKTVAFETSIKTTINGVIWDRVNYTITDSEGTFRGQDECLTRTDGTIDFFVYADANKFSANSALYGKMMNDIYVSNTAVDW